MSSSAEPRPRQAGNPDAGDPDNDLPIPGLGKPDCLICRGSGFYTPAVAPGEPGFGRAVPCSCWRAEREQGRLSRIVNANQAAALDGLTFDSFITEGHGLTPNEKRSLQFAKKETRAYAEAPSGWLLLRGGYGCGKTHLAAAVANYRLERGHPVLFLNTPDLLDHLRAAYSPSAETTYDERFDQVRTTPLLILDDLGAQSNTEWAQEKLFQIINHRYATRLPTVITTNLDEDEFEPRLRSRLGHVGENGVVRQVAINSRDFRIGADQSELSSLNLHGDKTFQSFDLREQELPRPQADNLRRALQEAVAFAEEPKGWLVFNSVAYGCGKTHLAAAIANYVTQNGDPALFVVVPDLLDYLRASYNPNSNARLDRRFNEARNAPLLVLDDLGTESATPWAREKLYQLFNYRYSARLPTIITTATPIEQLDPRLATRMLDPTRCSFFVLEVPSYRGKSSRAKRGGSGRRA
jgi:DNA replication protein DnaC